MLGFINEWLEKSHERRAKSKAVGRLTKKPRHVPTGTAAVKGKERTPEVSPGHAARQEAPKKGGHGRIPSAFRPADSAQPKEDISRALRRVWGPEGTVSSLEKYYDKIENGYGTVLSEISERFLQRLWQGEIVAERFERSLLEQQQNERGEGNLLHEFPGGSPTESVLQAARDENDQEIYEDLRARYLEFGALIDSLPGKNCIDVRRDTKNAVTMTGEVDPILGNVIIVNPILVPRWVRDIRMREFVEDLTEPEAPRNHSSSSSPSEVPPITISEVHNLKYDERLRDFIQYTINNSADKQSADRMKGLPMDPSSTTFLHSPTKKYTEGVFDKSNGNAVFIIGSDRRDVPDRLEKLLEDRELYRAERGGAALRGAGFTLNPRPLPTHSREITNESAVIPASLVASGTAASAVSYVPVEEGHTMAKSPPAAGSPSVGRV